MKRILRAVLALAAALMILPVTVGKAYVYWGERVKITEEENTIVDMRQEDAWIVEHIWREWLMPEETDAEYVHPNQIVVMQRIYSSTLV